MKYILFLLMAKLLIADNYIKSDGIVIDTKRDLMWQDNLDTTKYISNWTLSKEYCSSLTLNGYTDWRLPDIKELQLIIDITKRKPSINNQFKFIVDSSYWSSSIDLKNKKFAWYVGFKTGGTFRGNKDYDCYTRCIRLGKKK